MKTKLIKLTSAKDGNSIYLNPFWIEHVEKADDGKNVFSRIILVRNEWYSYDVKETPEEIMELIAHYDYHIV